MTVSSTMPPFSLVIKLYPPVPSAMPPMLATVTVSRKSIASLPYSKHTAKSYRDSERIHALSIKQTNIVRHYDREKISEAGARKTLKLTPNMCDTSKRDALLRHQFVASMIESLYWIGMDQPAKSTILPAAGRVQQRTRKLYVRCEYRKKKKHRWQRFS